MVANLVEKAIPCIHKQSVAERVSASIPVELNSSVFSKLLAVSSCSSSLFTLISPLIGVVAYSIKPCWRQWTSCRWSPTTMITLQNSSPKLTIAICTPYTITQKRRRQKKRGKEHNKWMAYIIYIGISKGSRDPSCWFQGNPQNVRRVGSKIIIQF